MSLVWDEWAVLGLAPPAYRAFAFVGCFVSVEAPKRWAYDVVFCPHDVRHRVASVEEGVVGEDLGGDYADWFGVGGVDAGFGYEGGDDAFDEDVEAVD